MADTPRIIQPRTLKGFRDILPATMLAREELLEQVRGVFRAHGYCPFDTPALEYTEILLGNDRQMYRFTDNGGRDVALRFDLTVPLARFIAQHAGGLGVPFRGYHIGSVWRGENTQRGRYREFMQCDFDAIGTESVVADVETLVVINDLLDALGVGEFTIRINSREILAGVLEGAGLAERAVPLLRALDKLDKIGRDGVATEMMAEAGVDAGQADTVLSLAELDGSAGEVLAGLAELVVDNEGGQRGLARLGEIIAAAKAAGVADSRLAVAPAIARGLDYYTGVVFETTLDELEDIGSVCSGGRYDDLAGLYTKQRLPGVGASLGLDRLLAAMDELGQLPARSTAAPVFIALFDPERLHEYLGLAAELRRAGIGCEVHTEAKKLGAQLKYADRRGFQLALVMGEREWERGICQVRTLASGDKCELELKTLAQDLGRLLGEPRAGSRFTTDSTAS
jgi:histidyl-tRNA synthetase